jgi:hypothetical protein
MNAYDVLFDHHNTLRGLCKRITVMPPTSDERQETLDELVVELDIHMRIEGRRRASWWPLRTPPKRSALCPPPVEMSDDELDAPGDQLLARSRRKQ